MAWLGIDPTPCHARTYHLQPAPGTPTTPSRQQRASTSCQNHPVQRDGLGCAQPLSLMTWGGQGENIGSKEPAVLVSTLDVSTKQSSERGPGAAARFNLDVDVTINVSGVGGWRGGAAEVEAQRSSAVWIVWPHGLEKLRSGTCAPLHAARCASPPLNSPPCLGGRNGNSTTHCETACPSRISRH